jgi:hypothetical protein
MRQSIIGKDYISIDESNINDKTLLSIPKIHIIKLQFKNVTDINIKLVIKNFPNTNRFVISDNIREYNTILKTIGKKFYVENTINTPFISFFRKNNKVLLNLNNLRKYEKDFILNEEIFTDILKNIEIVQLNKGDFDILLPLFDVWNGNVIVSN